MAAEQLTDRERQVLQAVIRAYVESAEPAGSRTVARRFRLGVSPATVRNTMSDLEDKGFLSHPHASAGRVPTDRAYRYYVDTLMRPVKLTAAAKMRLWQEIRDEGSAPLERLVRRAAQALGLLTGELGLAVALRLEEAVLEKLELLRLSSDKVLLVLTLRGGVVRTIFVDLPGSVPAEALVAVNMILNERLAGLTLHEIRQTLPERLRDSRPVDGSAASELLNIFMQRGDELFDWPGVGAGELQMGHTSVLAKQPEFSSGTRLKSLIELTERRDLLAGVLRGHEHDTPLQITIGEENPQPELNDFTLVTSEYRSGELSGVIGVIGPTRMPYEKIVVIVEHTSALISALLSPAVLPQRSDAGSAEGPDAAATPPRGGSAPGAARDSRRRKRK